MYWDVVEVKPLEGLALFVRFEDGVAGEVRFNPQHLTGVFEPLKDPGYFSQVFIDQGAVTWPGHVDLAPDAMYAAIKAHGVWILA